MEDDDLFPEDEDQDLIEAANEHIEQAPEPSSSGLTMTQRARIERNRLKAISLKEARMMKRPHQSTTTISTEKTVTGERASLGREKKLVDTGAGFFIEEDEEVESEAKKLKVTEIPAPILKPDQPECRECGKKMADSFLLRTFDLPACDECKDTEKDGKHELITKTDAKNTFLLKDYDVDKREPVLKFILRKNPHNPRWGDMKLFLREQIEKRALEVWGSEEALEKQHEEREAKKEKAKTKKFNKQIKALRMQVRGSLYKKDLSTHEHQFGEEQYDEEEDEYLRECETCQFIHRYDKL